MIKFSAVALIPLFAGFLYAQADQTTTKTETQTTTSNFNGTLVDASCRTTRTEHNTSSTSSPDENTTKTETTHSTSNTVDCPVTATTTSFGMMSPDGKYVRFDDPGNTKVIEIMKSNKKWSHYIATHEPLRVRVVGHPDGDTVVVQSIQ
jgi:hypothetical protein